MATQKVPNLELGDAFGCLKPKYTMCRTCANAHGEAPWADAPGKSYCLAYTRESGYQKPSTVYYDGGDCPFYTRG